MQFRTICVITFCVKKLTTFCVGKLLHFALIILFFAPTNLSECKAFFDSLHEFFFPADFGGDFNCYEHEMDKLGGNISIADYLTDFCSSFGLIDCWRKLHPRARELTWFNSDFSIGSHLD